MNANRRVGRMWQRIMAGSLTLGVIAIAITVFAYSPAPPDGFSLQQNFPNPFSSTTEIRYELPEAGHVLLRVNNTLGLEVQTLVNENQLTGNHIAHFDGSSYPSGQYTYTLDFTSNDDGAKMKLQKRMYLVR